MTTIRIEGDGFVVDTDAEHYYQPDAFWYDESECEHKQYVHATILNPGQNLSQLPTSVEVKYTLISFMASMFIVGLFILALWRIQ